MVRNQLRFKDKPLSHVDYEDDESTDTETEPIAPGGLTTSEILRDLQITALHGLLDFTQEWGFQLEFQYLFKFIGKFWRVPLRQCRSRSLLSKLLGRSSFTANACLCLLPHLKTFIQSRVLPPPEEVSTTVGIPIKFSKMWRTYLLYLNVKRRPTIWGTTPEVYTIEGLAEPFFRLTPVSSSERYERISCSYIIEPEKTPKSGDYNIDEIELVREINRKSQSDEPLYLILSTWEDTWYVVRWMDDGQTKLYCKTTPCHGYEALDASQTFTEEIFFSSDSAKVPKECLICDAVQDRESLTHIRVTEVCKG